MKTEWGTITFCSRCGKKATEWMNEEGLFYKSSRFYCKTCLLVVLWGNNISAGEDIKKYDTQQ